MLLPVSRAQARPSPATAAHAGRAKRHIRPAPCPWFDRACGATPRPCCRFPNAGRCAAPSAATAPRSTRRSPILRRRCCAVDATVIASRSRPRASRGHHALALIGARARRAPCWRRCSRVSLMIVLMIYGRRADRAHFRRVSNLTCSASNSEGRQGRRISCVDRLWSAGAGFALIGRAVMTQVARGKVLARGEMQMTDDERMKEFICSIIDNGRWGQWLEEQRGRVPRRLWTGRRHARWFSKARQDENRAQSEADGATRFRCA